ncbi:hypothetical protein GCM10008171_24240 [Methylopila jiangsuensis]|uniref:Uncharacterized protein n=1 Tax=Methylopila jiangsuensis TaxID=586230 RepID=A0A9W6N4B4_9HYPH|nr:hypothetical protein [Methylopila jiangsuensis]MDR6286490.1 hypothetical protein [Methylopila jiangsuensis]GLK77170.1 hypothetical protein GCM10008171_24240 [Methylopila jiangsuensis]
MAEQDPRVHSMFQKDCGCALLAVASVWAIYAFTYWMMAPAFAAVGVQWLMALLGLVVLLLNAAAVAALLRHYRDDKAAIYGTDIYYLDQLAAERRAP